MPSIWTRLDYNFAMMKGRIKHVQYYFQSDSPAVTTDMRIKKPTGIPLEHMLIVSEALPGTYKTHSGHYAVPKIDA